MIVKKTFAPHDEPKGAWKQTYHGIAKIYVDAVSGLQSLDKNKKLYQNAEAETIRASNIMQASEQLANSDNPNVALSTGIQALGFALHACVFRLQATPLNQHNAAKPFINVLAKEVEALQRESINIDQDPNTHHHALAAIRNMIAADITKLRDLPHIEHSVQVNDTLKAMRGCLTGIELCLKKHRRDNPDIITQDAPESAIDRVEQLLSKGILDEIRYGALGRPR